MRIAGVEYQVGWKKFRRGTSLFFPCLNTKEAKVELGITLKRLKIEVLTKVVVEEGIKGIRVWRV